MNNFYQQAIHIFFTIMKYFEILLKIIFAALAIFLVITGNITSMWFCLFLLISFILGIVLIFNKKESYSYKNPKKGVFVTRRIEGVLLIIFSVAIFVLNLYK